MDYQQIVNGIVVNVSTRTYVLVETIENESTSKGEIVGDFIDLQRKIGTIIDSFDLLHDSCSTLQHDQPGRVDSTKGLRFSEYAALLSIGGDVTMWQCWENPVTEPGVGNSEHRFWHKDQSRRAQQQARKEASRHATVRSGLADCISQAE